MYDTLYAFTQRHKQRLNKLNISLNTDANIRCHAL